MARDGSRNRITRAVRAVTKLPWPLCRDAVDLIWDAMTAVLGQGVDVKLTNFGTFNVTKWKARSVPLDGNRLRTHVIPARYVVRFMPYVKLRQSGL